MFRVFVFVLCDQVPGWQRVKEKETKEERHSGGNTEKNGRTGNRTRIL